MFLPIHTFTLTLLSGIVRLSNYDMLKQERIWKLFSFIMVVPIKCRGQWRTCAYCVWVIIIFCLFIYWKDILILITFSYISNFLGQKINFSNKWIVKLMWVEDTCSFSSRWENQLYHNSFDHPHQDWKYINN